MSKILIIDDDENITDILSIALVEEGYEIICFNDAAKAKDFIAVGDYDLILMDIMMPDVNGYDLCKHSRVFTDVPILFITCVDSEESLISALTLGGDDYIKKPFNLTELIMRVKVHLRRVEKNKKLVRSQIYKAKKFTFYLNKNLIITQDEENVHLSPLESDLLCYFFENQNSLVTYKSIYESIWNEKYLRDKSTIMTRVSNLRNKIPAIEIDTVRGKGYIFVN